MNSSINKRAVRSGRCIALTLLAGSMIGAFGAASAGAATTNAADGPSVAVRYGDLDLTSEGGARRLYHRLVVAARQVCPDGSSRDFSTLRAVEACRNQAILRAARQIPSPQLATLVATSIKAS
jgi:UrcA family protein